MGIVLFSCESINIANDRTMTMTENQKPINSWMMG